MMSGEPSGLRVSDWNTAPETPSPAPRDDAGDAHAGARHSPTTVLTMRLSASPEQALEDFSGGQ
jgi:hypothetical protein